MTCQSDKVVLIGKFVLLNYILEKENRLIIKDLSLHLKKLDKEHNKLKESRIFKKKRYRGEISRIETNEQQRK